MARVVSVDGRLVPTAEAGLSLLDRGFSRGLGGVERLRAYGETVLAFQVHYERLRATCESLGVTCPPADLLATRLDETLGANDLADALVRLTVTAGVDSSLADTFETSPVDPDGGGPKADEQTPTVIVEAEPAPRGGRSGTPTWDAPATLQTVKTRRRSAEPAGVVADRIAGRARRELRVTGADEALVLDEGGAVTGGVDSALFFVAGDAVRTPGGTVTPAEGATRAVVLELLEREGIPVRRGEFVPDDVRDADEAFVCNPRWEVRPVETVDGLSVGDGPVTALVSGLFDERVEQACYATEPETPE